MNTGESPLPRRPCPVCGNLGSKLLFEQRFEPLSGVYLVNGYDVVVCVQCGAGFADGIPSQEAFDMYYRDLSKYEYADRGGRECASDQQRFVEIAAGLMDSIQSPDAKILELGCATGGLLAVLRENGFPNVQGIDPSPGCAHAAWDLYRIPVFTRSLFAMPPVPGSFEFVIMVGVLEHIEDVFGAVKVLRDLLTSDGRLYMEVPDASRLANRSDAPFQEFSTEHINFFSALSLTNLFESNGFKTIKTGRPIRRQNTNTTCPAAFGIYQRSDQVSEEKDRDNETEAGLLSYILESQGEDARIRELIERRAGGKDILVWGTGTHTQRLVATGAFKDVHIRAFVDSNPKYEGQQLAGIPILAPRALCNRPEPILISSRGSQAEISHQIRSTFYLENDLILLYELQ